MSNKLSNNDLQELIKQVSPRERERIFWDIEKDNYIEKPVDINTFLFHPNFLGKLYNDRGKSKLFPFWVRLANEVYPYWFYTKYNEIIASLPIGVGKSTVTCGAFATYEQYKLLCLKNPAEYYGLLSNSVIATALFSSTKELVSDVNWPKLRDAIVVSPWFKKRLNLDEIDPKIKSADLTKNVSIQLGSRTQHAISRDVLIAVVDEGNTEVVNDQVKENYYEIYERRRSRFEKGFRVPGILFACSSPKGEDDFINSRIKLVEGDPQVKVIDNIAEWEIKDKKWCGKKFWLFVGDDKSDGHILDDKEDRSGYDSQLLIHAPIEEKASFERDFIRALRDVAGRRSIASTALYKSKDSIKRCLCGQNIFTKDIIELDVHANLDEIMPFLNKRFIKLCLQRTNSRMIGVDFGLNNDKFGFAMGYAHYPINPEENDRKYVDKNYVIEGVVSFKAKNKLGVPSAAVRQLIRYFRELGFPIQLISGDKPAIVMLQDLVRDAFNVKYLSVDTSRIPHHTVKDQVSMNTIIAPDSPLLFWEMLHLMDDGLNTIDHPSKVNSGWCPENIGKTVPGSKDLIDACAHVVYNSFVNPIQTNLMDLAEQIHRYNKDVTSITTQDGLKVVQPSYYSTNKKPMNAMQAQKLVMDLFNKK